MGFLPSIEFLSLDGIMKRTSVDSMGGEILLRLGQLSIRSNRNLGTYEYHFIEFGTDQNGSILTAYFKWTVIYIYVES